MSYNLDDLSLGIIRFFDDLIPKVPTKGDDDITEGTKKMDEGKMDEGEAQVLKGVGEKEEEREKEKKE